MSYIGGTAIGLKYNGGVLLAADKAYILGNMVLSSGVRKIFPITNYVGAAAAGIVADMQELFKEVSWYANLRYRTINRPLEVRSIAKLTSVIMYHRRLFPYFTQILIGGYLNKPELYSLDSLGSLIGDDYIVIGSGAENAIGILDSEYSIDISSEEAFSIALKAFKATIKRDVLSGSEIDIMTIDKDGYKIVSKSLI
ncbi:proteasome subunit beta [Candidatus Geothermarchaeota archaeon]|nr:MAG: proteasome subunit beta [Candidatus Geothermarchaeota archaeon]RLG63085.1 MAG: proteasome subunit beta [Candidatus Geothermarchaeota archaeon]HEW93387.1 proteasome subunit beta [Thermoprotei archaeon]